MPAGRQLWGQLSLGRRIRMTKCEEKPHEPRRGWLKNGNSSGDFTKAPRCSAKTRRSSECQCAAMINGRCSTSRRSEHRSKDRMWFTSNTASSYKTRTPLETRDREPAYDPISDERRTVLVQGNGERAFPVSEHIAISRVQFGRHRPM
jgi:hypothetical protein